jgi:hypothetical protein
VTTFEGAEAGEEAVGGVGGGEVGDGAAGDLAGDVFGAADMGAVAGAGAAIEAELNSPKAKTKQRSALNRAILSGSCCSRRILQIRVTETLCSRSLI